MARAVKQNRYGQQVTDEEFLEQILKNPFEPNWDECGEAPLDQRFQKVLKIIEPFNTFLEIGPGYGAVSLHLLSKGKEVDMVDLTVDNLLAMENICEQRGYYFVLHLGSIIDIEIGKFFDVVFALEVVEHIRDYKRAINNMIKLAKHKVVITTPVGKSFYSPDHKHFFSERSFDFIQKPYTIQKIITKNADKYTGQRCFLIEVNTNE